MYTFDTLSGLKIVLSKEPKIYLMAFIHLRITALIICAQKHSEYFFLFDILDFILHFVFYPSSITLHLKNISIKNVNEKALVFINCFMKIPLMVMLF